MCVSILHGPTSELLVCNLTSTTNVSSTMKQLAEQEWGIHSSQITLTNEGKKMPHCFYMIQTYMCQSNNTYLVVLKSVKFVVRWLNTIVMNVSKNFVVIVVQRCTNTKKQRSQTLPNSMYDDSGPMFHVVKEVDGMGSSG